MIAALMAVMVSAAAQSVPAVPAAPAAEAAPVSYRIDPAASEVVFHMQTTWHGVEGRTKAISGRLTSAGGDILVDGGITVEVEAATLDTGNARRDRTMKDDYLETARFPAITFVSTGPPGGAPPASPGDLTIHGVTRRVTLPFLARREGDAWVVTGEVTVRLSEHGIRDPSIFLNAVKDEVKVTYRVTLVR